MELTAAIQALQWLWEKYSGKTWTWSEDNVQDGFFTAEQPSIVVINEYITLITDSSYVKLGITEWMVTRKRRQRRRAKGGKLVENVGLRKQLDALVTCFPNLERQRTKAHVGTILNERVDQLAREEANRYG
jgi:ribonuclease HI